LQILCIIYEYPPIGGGGSVVAAALNEQLALDGHSVRVITSMMKGLAPDEEVAGVDVHRSACFRTHRHYTTTAELLTTLLPAYKRAVQMIEQKRPDVIHAHFAVPSGVVAYFLWRRYRIPYVLTTHGSDIPGYNPDRFEFMHRLIRPLWKRIVKHAAAITSPSKYLANLLQHSAPLPVSIVPNGYEPPTTRGSQAKRNLVLVVARLFPRKGVQHFIEAVSGLSTDWEYVIAGDGPFMAQLKARAEALKSPVKFAGFVDKTTLREMYLQARIFVFPSIQENFPMVLLEAMDAGCAVITTDAEGCAEVVGDTGIITPRANSLELRRALAKLMNDEKAREQLSSSALARAQKFRWSRIAGQYVSIFDSVVQGRDGAGKPVDVPADELPTALKLV